MTLLSKKLQELSARFGAAHRDEHALIVELNKRLERQDDHLRDELTAVIENHDARRAGLHELLVKLSERVGALPLVRGAPDVHVGPEARVQNDVPEGFQQGVALLSGASDDAIDAAIDETEPLPNFLRDASDARVVPEARFQHDHPRLGSSSPISETVPTH